MAFVASSIPVVSGPLPSAIDIGGNNQSFPLFSHIRVVGAGTVTFDSGQVATATAGTDSVFAIPGAARNIIIGGGTPLVQYGKMD